MILLSGAPVWFDVDGRDYYFSASDYEAEWNGIIDQIHAMSQGWGTGVIWI